MPFAFVQSNSASVDAASASLGVALTGVGASNLIEIWVKHEGTPVGIVVSDGTTTLTPATKTNHANNDLSGQHQYLLVANSGNKTYTVSFTGGVTRPFIRVVVNEYSYSGTASLDGEAGNTSTGSTSVTSTNMTTTATDGVAFGGYAEYDVGSLSSMQVNGVAADGSQGVTNSTFAWRKTFSAGFTGAATATLSAGTFAWICRAIAFKAEAAGGVVNTVVKDDTIVMTDQFVSSAYRNRDGADVTIISEGGFQSVLRNVFADDQIVLVDEVLRYALYFRFADDATIVVDESLASLVGQNIINAVISDAIFLVDDALAYMQRNRDGSDLVSISDSGDRTMILNRTHESVAELVDDTFKTLRWFKQFTDSVDLIDSVAALYLTPTEFDGSRLIVGFDPAPILVGFYQPIETGFDPHDIRLGGFPL